MAKPKKSRRSNNSSADDNGGNFGQRVSIQPDSNKEFQLDRILCRAYSLDSNISDLSGSVGGPHPRSRGASNVRSTSADENIFMSIVNDCAALTGISEVVAQGQEAFFGGTTSRDKTKSIKKKGLAERNTPSLMFGAYHQLITTTPQMMILPSERSRVRLMTMSNMITLSSSLTTTSRRLPTPQKI
jgi:hypothetical protein